VTIFMRFGHIERIEQYTLPKVLISSIPTSMCGRGDQKLVLTILFQYDTTVIAYRPQCGVSGDGIEQCLVTELELHNSVL
jgi:hypothetical protein